jgi:hypothetical protein
VRTRDIRRWAVAIGDVYRLSVVAQGQGSLYMNTYAMVQEVASVTQADFVSLADAIKESMRLLQNSTVSYRSWRAVQVRGGDVAPVATECRRTGGAVFEAAFTGSVNGGVSGDALPPQSAFVVTQNTGKVGRRFRGRTYHFGFTETDQQAGLWLAGLINTATTNLNNLVTLYGAAGTSPTWTLGVWSERIATGCRPDPITGQITNVDPPNLIGAFSPITGLTVRSTVFTQRRRTLGVGL